MNEPKSDDGSFAKRFPYVRSDKRAVFNTFLIESLHEFYARIEPSPHRSSKIGIAAEMHSDLLYLVGYWDIKKTTIRKAMVDLNRIVPLQYRHEGLLGWLEGPHQKIFDNLLLYIQSHFTAWVPLSIEIEGVSAYLRDQGSTQPYEKVLGPKDFTRLASILWVVLKIFRLPWEVNTSLIKMVRQDKENRLPIIWRELPKKMGRRLSYEGKNGEIGIIEASLGTIRKKGPDQSAEISADGKVIIGDIVFSIVHKLVEAQVDLGELATPEFHTKLKGDILDLICSNVAKVSRRYYSYREGDHDTMPEAQDIFDAPAAPHRYYPPRRIYADFI